MNNIELITCDDCGAVKPLTAYRSPGHTAGGQVNGYDIDTCICAECAQRAYQELQADLAETALASMAAEEKPVVVTDRNAYRQYIAPLVVGNRWVYWAEQLQPDGSRRGFPMEYPQGVRAWRTDQVYVAGEQMTGMVTERVEGAWKTFRSAIVSVGTPTREQYDGWQATRGQLVSARK